MDTPQGKVPEVLHVSNQSAPRDAPERAPRHPREGLKAAWRRRARTPREAPGAWTAPTWRGRSVRLSAPPLLASAHFVRSDLSSRQHRPNGPTMAALYPTLSTLNPRSRRRIFAQRMSPSTSFKSKAFLQKTEMFTMADFSLATCPKNLFKLGHKLFICEIYHDPPLMSCQLKRERLGWF